jgi:hypothetical protein
MRVYVPNPMRCLRCQKFGHTPLQRVSSTVLSLRREWPRRRPMSESPLSASGGFHFSGDKNGCVSGRESIQDLKVKEGLTFPETRKSFLELKSRNTDIFLRRPTGVDTATQTSAPTPSEQTGSTNTNPSIHIHTDRGAHSCQPLKLSPRDLDTALAFASPTQGKKLRIQNHADHLTCEI